MCSEIKQDNLNRSPIINISTETNAHCHNQSHKDNATLSNPKETHSSETTDCCNKGEEETVHEGNITTKSDNKSCNVDCSPNCNANCKTSTPENPFETPDTVGVKRRKCPWWVLPLFCTILSAILIPMPGILMHGDEL